MADDALPSIKTSPANHKIDPLLDVLRWSKADLARFLNVTRATVSRWAHDYSRMNERQKAAVLFLKEALETEMAQLPDRRGDRERIRFQRQFGEWAKEKKIRGLVLARFGQESVPDVKPMGPDLIRDIRHQLGWIQAEMAAFFGVTHSTPSKWEGPDPQVGAATEAELIALREWFYQPRATKDELRDLWGEGVRRFMTTIVGWEAGIFSG